MSGYDVRYRECKDIPEEDTTEGNEQTDHDGRRRRTRRARRGLEHETHGCKCLRQEEAV
jgi:hypothetical protein